MLLIWMKLPSICSTPYSRVAQSSSSWIRRERPSAQVVGPQALQRVVHAADRVVTVDDHVVEAEQPGCQLAVDREAGRGQRRRAERAPIRSGEGCLDPDGVALQRLRRGRQEVPERRRLGRLGVGVAGHQRLGVLLDPAASSVARSPSRQTVHLQQLTAQAEPRHRRVEVVAAAGEVQIAAGLLAGLLHDPRFHLEEQVLHLGS